MNMSAEERSGGSSAIPSSARARGTAVRRVLRRMKHDVLVPTLMRFGYDTRHWARVAMYRECRLLLDALEPSKLDVLEISAGDAWRDVAFHSYRETSYPDFDVCERSLDDRFDLIIADQVFEHLLRPHAAARNVHAMLRPGGHALVTTPFLLRIHASPVDCSRWTELGLKQLLAESGFPIDTIRTGSWGNRACVTANFTQWAVMGWGWNRPMNNEPDFPVVVWAIARA